MSDDYLWDRSGQADPEVERLEQLLSELRHNRPAPQFPAAVARLRPSRFRLLMPLAAAALVVLAIAGPWFWLRWSRPAWDVARLAGSPTIGSTPIGDVGRLAPGQLLETDAASRAKIEVGSIGQVEVGPNTRVRLIKTRTTEHRIALERGAIEARIWAPPGLFFVDTPSAVAVDLGCAYTLEVDDAGVALLYVKNGWVGFESNGLESFVPAGAYCQTFPGIGPGTPYFEDASEAFRRALGSLDFGRLNPTERGETLMTILAEARKDDTLTLWHLLFRGDETERGRVYDRMAQLVPPPKGVTREGILRLDRKMLDLWWNQLDLGSVNWWRMWKGPSPFQR
ncbi:MAG TPA: FecR domain-containing protein [Acidobacteriota bacterium]|jgi:hypothetical protein